MTMRRRLINLVGVLVVIVALVAGTLLMALPVYLDSVDIRNEKARVAAANQVLVAQIDGLQIMKARFPQLQEELDELRSELPRIPQLDDLMRLALRAADKTDGTIQDISFSEPVAFAPRGLEDVIPDLPPTATDVSADDEDEQSTAGTPSDGAATDAGTGAPPGSGTPEPSAAQLQVPVTITVTVPNTAAASRFLDELRAGPRLLQVTTASGTVDTTDGNAVLTLTVNGLVFVQSK